MNTAHTHTNLELDDEERDILDSFERGEWTKAGTTSIAQLQEAANTHLSAIKLSVTLPSDDFALLQRKETNLGISIQDLAARILHASLGNTNEYAK